MNVTEKRKYVQPIARDLSGMPHAEGRCMSGSVAQPKGFEDCIFGYSADGGVCWTGQIVAGCIVGAVVTNWCSVGGTAG